MGEVLHAVKPNDMIHFDWCYIGASEAGPKYILVIKDDCTKYVMLFARASADAKTTKECLLQWMATFGVCLNWVSDQGSHFKNELIKELQHSLGGSHHFHPARCPWANGSVEVVNYF
jgi:transposase InsO family protein